MGEVINLIKQRIDEALLEKREGPRTYLGASQLGTECDRQLWMSFFHPKPVENPTTLRKFMVGHRLEPMMVELLKKAGFNVHDVDENGDQFGFEDGKIAGHCDGFIEIDGEWYLLEFKTSNSFYFKQFKKEGFENNNKYRVQVHIYMHKFKLNKCLAFVLNKDDQEIYLEIINYDEKIAKYYLKRGYEILESETIPDRKYSTKMNFNCKFCNYYKECWNENSGS